MIKIPSRWFLCPDQEEIEIAKCLQPKGCRMKERCAALPYLRLIGYDREWKGISPSSAGSGARSLYLKATTDYTIDPEQRVWAAFGTSTHNKLSLYSYNVLSEETLTDGQMQGIADLLEEDENQEGYFNLWDFKNWGSYKAALALGITTLVEEETVLDEDGKPRILKSGKNKGKVKTKQKRTIVQDDSKADLRSEELQLNRYRIFYEESGFPISKMLIQVMVRDGGLYIAKNRGIEKNKYIIPIRRIPNSEVLSFYQVLSAKMEKAFKYGYSKKCDLWESMNGQKCERFCEVKDSCQLMSKSNNERWGLI